MPRWAEALGIRGSRKDVTLGWIIFQKFILLCNHCRGKHSSQYRTYSSKVNIFRIAWNWIFISVLWDSLNDPCIFSCAFWNTWSRCSFGRREGQGQNKARKAAVHPWNPRGSSVFPEMPWVSQSWAIRTLWSSLWPSDPGGGPLINSGAKCPFCIARWHIHASDWCTTKSIKLWLHSKKEALLIA